MLDKQFSTIYGFPHLSQRSIMPVVAMKGDEIRPIGTCFAISSHGLVLTARHVVDEAYDLVNGLGSPNTVTSIGALYAAVPDWHDEVPDLLGGLLPLNKAYFIPSLDIAVMHLKLPVHIVTNALLPVLALRLSPGIPK